MSINSLKKTIVFSSQEGKRLIELMLADEAQVTGRTISAALENHLLYEPLLSTDSNHAFWIQDMYLRDNAPGAVIADYAADSCTLPDKYLNTQAFHALMDYCRRYCISSAVFKDESEVRYLTSQIKTVTESMRSVCPPEVDENIVDIIRRDAEQLDAMSDIALRSLCFDAGFVYKTFGKYADVVRRCGRAYRLLAWLADHCRWDNSPAARYYISRSMRDPDTDIRASRWR